MKAATNLLSEGFITEPPDIREIITEDDEPVDNIFSEKQQRLLTESLNSSWRPGRDFVTAANVGIFYAVNQPPVVPDIFLSMDVKVADDLWEKKNRSYFLWEFGKPPEVVIEIASNKVGRETGKKFQIYAQMGIWYYIVFDPLRQIQNDVLRIYEFSARRFVPKIDKWLADIEIGVTLWEGVFEEKHDLWLRWRDEDGILIPTGFERAEQEKYRADSAEAKADQERIRADSAEAKAEQEKYRADSAEAKADQERIRAEKMAKKLRELGIDPEEV